MSIVPARRSQVTLQIGGDLTSGDRATLAAQLLDRGLEVLCRRDEGAVAIPTDVEALAEVAAARRGRPTSPVRVPSCKPWFPVIHYSRWHNCMQCLRFC